MEKIPRLHYLQNLKNKNTKKIMNFKKESGRDAKSNKLLFNQNITFSKGVTKIESLPIETVPEVAFFGRSNVGKSSLLNSITNKSKLAYTSKSPGRTRELNFFSLNKNSKTLINIVDMPGYGFAKASKGQIKEWTNLSDLYLKTRKNLRRVFLLMDDFAVSYQIVLTKTDKILKVENLAELVLKEVEKRKAIFPRVLVTSSKSKIGIGEIREEIISLIN